MYSYQSHVYLLAHYDLLFFQVFYDVWKRTNPEQVAQIERELNVLTPEEQTIEIIKESGATDIALTALEKGSTIECGAELTKVTTELSKDIKQLPNVKEEVKDVLIDTLKSELQKDYGSRTEVKAIQHYETKEKESVRDNNNKFYKLELGRIDDTDIYVGGRIDGLNKRGRVVEVKNRMKRFFNPLPKYDIAQLQTYLQILDCQEGELVEHLRKKEKDLELETHTTIVKRDEKLWSTKLKPILLDFASKLKILMEDTTLQKRFLQEEESANKLDIIESMMSVEKPQRNIT